MCDGWISGLVGLPPLKGVGIGLRLFPHIRLKLVECCRFGWRRDKETESRALRWGLQTLVSSLHLEGDIVEPGLEGRPTRSLLVPRQEVQPLVTDVQDRGDDRGAGCCLDAAWLESPRHLISEALLHR